MLTLSLAFTYRKVPSSYAHSRKCMIQDTRANSRDKKRMDGALERQWYLMVSFPFLRANDACNRRCWQPVPQIESVV